MNYDLSKYLFQFLSNKMKIFAPLTSAIKGDLNRYHTILSNSDETNAFKRNIDYVGENGKRICCHFLDNKDIYVEAHDNTCAYNHLQVYISENRNKVEFIATKIDSLTGEALFREESEYLYELESGKSYIYHSQRSFLTDEELMSIYTYDRNGNEEKRNMYYNKFQPKVKTKVIS